MTPSESAAVCHFLVGEKRKRHIESEVLRRDRDLLIRKSRTNPASVRPDRIETACRLADRAHERDLYIGELLSGFPAVTG